MLRCLVVGLSVVLLAVVGLVACRVVGLPYVVRTSSDWSSFATLMKETCKIGSLLWGLGASWRHHFRCRLSVYGLRRIATLSVWYMVTYSFLTFPTFSPYKSN